MIGGDRRAQGEAASREDPDEKDRVAASEAASEAAQETRDRELAYRRMRAVKMISVTSSLANEDVWS